MNAADREKMTEFTGELDKAKTATPAEAEVIYTSVFRSLAAMKTTTREDVRQAEAHRHECLSGLKGVADKSDATHSGRIYATLIGLTPALKDQKQAENYRRVALTALKVRADNLALQSNFIGAERGYLHLYSLTSALTNQGMAASYRRTAVGGLSKVGHAAYDARDEITARRIHETVTALMAAQEQATVTRADTQAASGYGGSSLGTFRKG